MNKTGIEYLTHTWNPIAMRCTPISEGCANCWHLRIADRLAKNTTLCSGQRNAYAGGFPLFHETEIGAPLKVKRPAIIGVQFMGDFFHEDVTRESKEAVFRIIERCPHHTFVFLTKRPQNISSWWMPFMKNVWLGVSVENQDRADERIPLLLRHPAAVRFVSVEPMLGPIVLRRKAIGDHEMVQAALMGRMGDYSRPVQAGIDWVICGGESGPGARIMHPEWVRGLRDQCAGAVIPFFFKQWGSFIPADQDECPLGPPYKDWIWSDGATYHTKNPRCGMKLFRRVSKKTAGNILDGHEFRQMPEIGR